MKVKFDRYFKADVNNPHFSKTLYEKGEVVEFADDIGRVLVRLGYVSCIDEPTKPVVAKKKTTKKKTTKKKRAPRKKKVVKKAKETK